MSEDQAAAMRRIVEYASEMADLLPTSQIAKDWHSVKPYLLAVLSAPQQELKVIGSLLTQQDYDETVDTAFRLVDSIAETPRGAVGILSAALQQERERERARSGAVLSAPPAEPQKDEIARLREAVRILYDATFQSHSGHWDKQGTHGANCPECVRAREARELANAILKAAASPTPAPPAEPQKELAQFVLDKLIDVDMGHVWRKDACSNIRDRCLDVLEATPDARAMRLLWNGRPADVGGVAAVRGRS